MFFLLSKTLATLLMPVSLVFCCGLAAVLIKKPQLKRWAQRLTISLFIFFALPVSSRFCMRAWEIPVTPLRELHTTYPVGIVLTGFMNLDKQPADRPYFNKGADRLLHAFLLYEKGTIEKILITGGNIKLIHNEQAIKEAELAAAFLRKAGVKAEDILLETKARNTYENAEFSSHILNQQYPGEQFLLITSAFHMRRAKACFDKAGLNTRMFSTDFYTNDSSVSFNWFIPQAEGFYMWRVLFHEWIGMGAYWLAGYI